jgi:DAK2 domain fusion protein YloV
MFAAAATWLERHVDGVNALNVFPVPDGDTGTNMFLTMRSTLQGAEACEDEGAGEVLAAMSRGALMGARGNSGVILSQIIGGFAAAHQGRQALDPLSLAEGLEAGAKVAYQAVVKPAEGTILTVAREAAAAALKSVEDGARDIASVLASAADEAENSVRRTPTLLPVLAEAGVVDAGGRGWQVILQGMLRQLRGEPLDVELPPEVGAVGRDWLTATETKHATEDSLYGYCTELLVFGSFLDPDGLKERVLELGDSVIVVGDETLVRIHVHTDDPGAVLTRGTAVGTISEVKVDNIRQQAERFVFMHERLLGVPRPTLSTVAVVAGEGMADIFQSVGCTRTIPGGPTMNPSTGDILKAVEACATRDVVVLPNDKNVIRAAQQAVEAASKVIHVVPSTSMPQGLAALLQVSPEDDAQSNVSAMAEALTSVRTLEITRAVRSTRARGVSVKAGQGIAIVDGQLKVAADTIDEAAMQALAGVVGDSTGLITIYNGADTTKAEAAAFADAVRARFFPDFEQDPTQDDPVQFHYGGQPHYDYIISVE